MYFLYSINFLKLCQIILENVPSVLREFFKSQYNTKYKQQWTGTFSERWCSKLDKKQVQLLESSDTDQWDATLVFHVLLYSSLCLYAKKIQDTKFTVQIKSDMVKAVATINLKLKNGDKIIIDLGSDPFFSVVKRIEGNRFFIRDSFNFPPCYQGDDSHRMLVDVYVLQKEWDYIKELAKLRNASFAHSTKASITTKQLSDIIQTCENIYRKLNIPKETISAMKSIEHGKQHVFISNYCNIHIVILSETVEDYTYKNKIYIFHTHILSLQFL